MLDAVPSSSPPQDRLKPRAQEQRPDTKVTHAPALKEPKQLPLPQKVVVGQEPPLTQIAPPLTQVRSVSRRALTEPRPAPDALTDGRDHVVVLVSAGVEEHVNTSGAP